jgi:hypothetical protein
VVTRFVVGVVLVDVHDLLLRCNRFQCYLNTSMVSDLVVKVLVDYSIGDGDTPCIHLIQLVAKLMSGDVRPERGYEVQLG